MKSKLTIASFLSSACLSSAVISVLKMDDTVGGFTTNTPLLADAPTDGNPSIGAADDAWGFAASAGNGQSQFGTAGTGTANLFNYVWGYRRDAGDTANAGTLATTVSGLNTGFTYDVYGYFVTSDVSNWNIQLGLNGGGLTNYANGGGTVLEQTSTSNLERVLIGTSAGGATSLIVNIEDGAGRSFIKGIGIEQAAAVPEPSSTALLGLGGLALIMRRRK